MEQAKIIDTLETYQIPPNKPPSLALRCSLLAIMAPKLSSGPKKCPKSFATFRPHLIGIFCKVKNKQKTSTGTRHYVNRLVPKKYIKLL